MTEESLGQGEKVPKKFLEALERAEKDANDCFVHLEKYMPADELGPMKNYRIAMELLETFKQELEKMILSKKYWPALESISYGLSYIQNNEALHDRRTFGELSEVGYFVNIHESIDFLLGKIKRGLKKENEKKMFDWLEKQIYDNQTRPNPTLTIYNSFASHNFTKKEFAERNKRRLTEQVSLFSQFPELGAILEDTVLDLIDVLERSGEEIYEFCLEYWYLPYVRERYFRYCLDRESYKELVALFEDAIKNYDAHVEADIWSYQCALEAYEKLGKTKKAVEALEWLIKNDPENVTMYYYQAKNLCGETWMKERKKFLPIFRELASNLARYGTEEQRRELEYIFEGEGMYEELAALMIGAPFGEFDERLTRAIEENLPEKAVDVWLNNLRYRAFYPERKTYKWMVGAFHRMEKLPGGQETIKKLLDDWRKEYPGRKLMWEIFEEAGY